MRYTHYHGGGHEDQQLREAWKNCPALGFYVDVGAGDPVALSNTYHFDRNGWNGLLIEANRQRCTDLYHYRCGTVECAVVGPEDDVEVDFWLSSHPDRSSVDRLHSDSTGNSEKRHTVTLERMLKRHSVGRIDLLSIDVEVGNLAIWRSMTFANHRPRAVIIEHEHESEAAIADEFAALGYELVARNNSNRVYVLED